MSSVRNSLREKALNRKTPELSSRWVCEAEAEERDGLEKGEKASRKFNQYE
jgi:SpoVK/Ycf46/Vps4 family AAA+-type ATPase